MSGSITDEQREEYQVAFTIFDEDGSGYIDRNELSSVCKKLGINLSTHDIDNMMKHVDKDENGQIDFEEFILIMKDIESQEPNQKEKELIDAFNVFDIDNDGFISKEELRQVMKNIDPKITEVELDAMIASIDADGDGQINYEEFVKASI